MVFDASGHYDICGFPLRVDELEVWLAWLGSFSTSNCSYLFKVGFDKSKPLFNHALDITAAVSNITQYYIRQQAT